MLEITREQFSESHLVVLVDKDGQVKWSSHRDRGEVVDMLRKVTDGIEDGSL